MPSGENPDGAESTEAPASRSIRWGRIVRYLAIGLAAVIAIAAVSGYALYRHFNGQITRVNIRLAAPASAPASVAPIGSVVPSAPAALPTASPAKAAAVVSADAENFLLMGSDSRGFVGGQAYNVAPGSSAYVTGQRSDVVMLLHIPADGAAATVISFPRDSWVQLPAFTDSAGVTHAAVMAKLNAAFDLGGAPLLVSTVEDLAGVHIDHFASVNFPGFQGMVNAIGGINVCIGTIRHDTNSGDFLTAGDHHLNGAQALALVRDRESFPDQDLGRIKDQEYFLSVMLHQVLSAGTLTNPIKLTEFLNVATKSLTVDSGLSIGDMRKLASRFKNLSSSNVSFETVPVENANYPVTSSIYGGATQSAVELDPVEMAALFTSLAGPQPSASGLPSIAPSQVDVTVENGTSVNGLAGDVATKLRAAGFTIVATQDALTSYPHTVISYGPAAAAAAHRLLAQEPGANLQASNASGDGVVLILGTDATPSAQSAPASPSPSATPATSLNCAP